MTVWLSVFRGFVLCSIYFYTLASQDSQVSQWLEERIGHQVFQCLGRRNSSSFLVLSGESRLRVPRCFFGSDSGPQGHRYAAGAGSNRKRTLWRQGIVTTCELRFVAGSNSVSRNFIQSIPGSSTFFYFFSHCFPVSPVVTLVLSCSIPGCLHDQRRSGASPPRLAVAANVFLDAKCRDFGRKTYAKIKFLPQETLVS